MPLSHVMQFYQALEDLSTMYDLSVRNSFGGVVQFYYGDDGLDPACLEGDAQPVEYVRAWSHASVRLPFHFNFVGYLIVNNYRQLLLGKAGDSYPLRLLRS